MAWSIRCAHAARAGVMVMIGLSRLYSGLLRPSKAGLVIEVMRIGYVRGDAVAPLLLRQEHPQTLGYTL